MTPRLPRGGGAGRARCAAIAAAAFLAFPAGAQGPAPAKAARCEVCHGEGGNSSIPGTPSIAGQPRLYLENQLVFFREGLRNAPVMEQATQGMTDAEIVALASHFSAQPPRERPAGPLDKAKYDRGAAIAAAHHCGQCHLPGLQGREQMPRLAGQREDYLLPTMAAYRDGKRTGADTTMSAVLHGMSDADLAALAHYLSRFMGSESN